MQLNNSSVFQCTTEFSKQEKLKRPIQHYKKKYERCSERNRGW